MRGCEEARMRGNGENGGRLEDWMVGSLATAYGSSPPKAARQTSNLSKLLIFALSYYLLPVFMLYNISIKNDRG